MNYQYQFNDTIVALATPPGKGAIGVIRLSGPQAIAITNRYFSKDLTQKASHTLHFGTIKKENGQLIDEVVASLFIGPKSYTGEHVVEVSCHGSNYIIERLIQLFIKGGARMAQPGEFTLRAFMNGRMDLSQAEAVADLIASDSESSHQLALQQMRGGFSEEIKALREQLINFASLIELELDFGEEDVEFANRDDLRQTVLRIQQLIYDLLRSFQLGNVLKKGVNTVIAGRPNAGKSTLLNALLNEERAIVSPIAGTTRDTIEEVININGIQFRLIDTAGIRAATDQIEAIGVEKTFEKVRQSAILVYVFDAAELPPKAVAEDLNQLIQENTPVLLIANKTDLPTYTTLEQYLPKHLEAAQIIAISAKNRANIEAIKTSLHDLVLADNFQSDQTIVSNIRHYEALQNAYDSLTAVLTGMDTGITSDFIAMDIRQSLHHLGEITGEIATDDLLDRIFRDFCIGK